MTTASYTTVKHWLTKFKSDRISITDEHQTGGSNILLPNTRTNNNSTGSDGVVSLVSSR